MYTYSHTHTIQAVQNLNSTRCLHEAGTLQTIQIQLTLIQKPFRNMECNSMSFINTHTNTYTTNYEALTENENRIPAVELVELTIIYKKRQLLAAFSSSKLTTTNTRISLHNISTSCFPS